MMISILPQSVFNAWLGWMKQNTRRHTPTIVVGRDLEDILIADPMNTKFMAYSVPAQNLKAGVGFAKNICPKG